MSAVDLHAEAHRLKDELGYGARRIGEELGVSRYAAERLMKRPLPQPVADAEQPVAEVAEVAEQPVAEVAEVAEQPAGPRPLPQRMTGPLDGIDVSRARALRREMALLTQSGLSQEALVHQAVVALAYSYRQALDRGDIEVGQAFLISTMALTPRPVAGRSGQTG